MLSTAPKTITKISGGGSSKTFKGRRSQAPTPLSESELKSQNWTWVDWIWWTAFNFSMMGCLIIGLASVRIPPPPHLPHLWSLLISVYCAVHFLLFAIYFHVLQWRYFYATGLPFNTFGAKYHNNSSTCHRWCESSGSELLDDKKKV